jgi:hypothetical protein
MEKTTNNLNKTQKGGMLETLFLCLAPMLFWIIVKEVLCTGLFITLLMVIKYAMLKKQNASEKGLVPSKAFYLLFGGIIAIIVTIMTCHMVFCHNTNTEEVSKQPETVESVPEEQKQEVEADDKTEETSKPTVDPNARRTANGTLDKHGKYTNNDGSLKDEIKVTKEANDPTKAKPEAKTTTGSTENKIVDTTNATADKETEKLIEEARKNDTKKVEDYKSDIVVITTPVVPETKISEEKSTDPEKDIIVKNEEVKDLPTAKENNETTAISEKVEDDKVVEMDKDELADLFKNSKAEEKSEKTATKTEEPKVEEVKEVETKTESVKTEKVVEETVINTEAKGDVKVEEAVETVEVKNTPVKEETKVETKSVESVKVTAIDGYTATVGSTIQFKVSGDDVKIDGLDGISYSFNNGILSVNTGSEATTLTVEASNSVNTVSFDIVINGIAQ